MYQSSGSPLHFFAKDALDRTDAVKLAPQVLVNISQDI
jgi:hypothetical protein